MIADPEGPSFIVRTVEHRRYSDGAFVTHDPHQTSGTCMNCSALASARDGALWLNRDRAAGEDRQCVHRALGQIQRERPRGKRPPPRLLSNGLARSADNSDNAWANVRTKAAVASAEQRLAKTGTERRIQNTSESQKLFSRTGRVRCRLSGLTMLSQKHCKLQDGGFEWTSQS